MGCTVLTSWLAEARVDGRVVVRVGRRGDELIAEFTNVGQLRLIPEMASVQFEPVAGTRGATFEKVRASVIDAFIRHAQGKLTLHGGVVGFHCNAVALMGPSRSGKSTLAAALCGEAGVGLIGDDTVAVEFSGTDAEAVEVIPTQKEAWLLPDTREALGLRADVPHKTAVPLRAGPGRTRLVAVTALVFDSSVPEPTLRRLRGLEAFSALSSSAFRFIVDAPDVQTREFEQLRCVVRNCPVYELRRPRDLRKLKLAIDLIVDLLRRTHSPIGAWS